MLGRSPFAAGVPFFENPTTWVLVAFLIFVGVLIYAGAFGQIGRMLDARAAEIRRQLNEARELREEAQRKLAEFERKSQEVQRQAAEIVEGAKREAEQAFAQAKAAIDETARRRERAAEEQIAQAEADAIRAVRDGAIDAAVIAAREVLGADLRAAPSTTMDRAIGEVAARIN